MLLSVNVEKQFAPFSCCNTHLFVVVFCHFRGAAVGLVVKVLDSKFKGCEFKTHTGNGSFSKA